MNSACQIENFANYSDSLPHALEAIGARKSLAQQSCILLKPNLVNTSPPPITLPVEAAEALIRYIRACSQARIIVAEGCGEQRLETDEIFRIHGYHQLAEDYGLELLDLNHAPLVELRNPACTVFPSFWMPKIVMTSFLISFAVLKAHSLADVTLSMKNLIGCAPPATTSRGATGRSRPFMPACTRRSSISIVIASLTWR